jgi:hypothetical protein
MVVGQRIDLAALDALIEPADLIIVREQTAKATQDIDRQVAKIRQTTTSVVVAISDINISMEASPQPLPQLLGRWESRARRPGKSVTAFSALQMARAL